MDIRKVSESLGTATKISLINSMILQLEGMIEQGRFNINEIDAMYSNLLIDRKFYRNVALGNLLTDYGDWTHFKAEAGYSIWKIQPDNYDYDALNELYLDDKVLSNMGEANAETDTFDKVFLGNSESGEGFTDDTAEAATEGGTEFEVMDDTSDYLYVGLASTFTGIKFEWQTRGLGYDLALEYYSSESGEWIELTSNLNDLADNTNDFASDGLISWVTPDDWTTNEINSVTKYWIRISTTDTPSTTAKAYYVVPGNSVESLLALSSTQYQAEEWKWCSYNDYIYVTIKNTGDSSYEGDEYITSTSSATNKQNFFIYNHTFKSDYLDSTYNPVKTKSSSYTILAGDGIIVIDASSDSVTASLPTAVGREGKEYLIKVLTIGSGNTAVLDCDESGETIDGASEHTFSADYEKVRVVSDGGDWLTI